MRYDLSSQINGVRTVFQISPTINASFTCIVVYNGAANPTAAVNFNNHTVTMGAAPVVGDVLSLYAAGQSEGAAALVNWQFTPPRPEPLSGVSMCRQIEEALSLLGGYALQAQATATESLQLVTSVVASSGSVVVEVQQLASQVASMASAVANNAVAINNLNNDLNSLSDTVAALQQQVENLSQESFYADLATNSTQFKFRVTNVAASANIGLFAAKITASTDATEIGTAVTPVITSITAANFTAEVSAEFASQRPRTIRLYYTNLSAATASGVSPIIVS